MFTQQKMFDLSFLEQMDDENFISEVVNLYILDTQTDLAEMDIAFHAGDLDTVCKTAHKLKSSTGMLQANTLFGLLEQTEQITKGGRNTWELAKLMQTVLYEFYQLKNGLESYLLNMRSVA